MHHHPEAIPGAHGLPVSTPTPELQPREKAGVGGNIERQGAMPGQTGQESVRVAHAKREADHASALCLLWPFLKVYKQDVLHSAASETSVCKKPPPHQTPTPRAECPHKLRWGLKKSLHPAEATPRLEKALHPPVKATDLFP